MKKLKPAEGLVAAIVFGVALLITESLLAQRIKLAKMVSCQKPDRKGQCLEGWQPPSIALASRNLGSGLRHIRRQSRGVFGWKSPAKKSSGLV
jgi:hypothetical protein